jgi:two-component system cell cycle sensor histidine kinase PleC
MISSGTVAIKSDKSVEYARFVHDSGHHLLALINDILDLSRIEAGALQLHESDIDTGLLVGDCVRLMTQKAEDTGVHLDCELDDGLPMLRADERALRQILLNLLSNALKFTPPDGTVTAFARNERDGSLSFGVRDTGIGIAEADRLRVFETFGQGRPDIATHDKGTGLGLPIVRGLAEAHGGRVELASEVGEGTCVSVWLPARRCHAARARAAG